MCQNLSLGPNISMDLKMYNYVCVLLLNAFKIGIRAIKEDKGFVYNLAPELKHYYIWYVKNDIWKCENVSNLANLYFIWNEVLQQRDCHPVIRNAWLGIQQRLIPGWWNFSTGRYACEIRCTHFNGLSLNCKRYLNLNWSC